MPDNESFTRPEHRDRESAREILCVSCSYRKIIIALVLFLLFHSKSLITVLALNAASLYVLSVYSYYSHVLYVIAAINNPTITKLFFFFFF